jgi:hypothetical protein
LSSAPPDRRNPLAVISNRTSLFGRAGGRQKPAGAAGFPGPEKAEIRTALFGRAGKPKSEEAKIAEK